MKEGGPTPAQMHQVVLEIAAIMCAHRAHPAPLLGGPCQHCISEVQEHLERGVEFGRH